VNLVNLVNLGKGVNLVNFSDPTLSDAPRYQPVPGNSNLLAGGRTSHLVDATKKVNARSRQLESLLSGGLK
jgi:hypothetical protein